MSVDIYWRQEFDTYFLKPAISVTILSSSSTWWHKRKTDIKKSSQYGAVGLQKSPTWFLWLFIPCHGPPERAAGSWPGCLWSPWLHGNEDHRELAAGSSHPSPNPAATDTLASPLWSTGQACTERRTGAQWVCLTSKLDSTINLMKAYENTAAAVGLTGSV